MTKTTNESRDDIIATLRANMARTEQEIAALPQHAWVIMWGDHALRTNGQRVGLLGQEVYWSTRSAIEFEAEQFALTVEKSDIEMKEPVIALGRDAALAAVTAANAQLLASITK